MRASGFSRKALTNNSFKISTTFMLMQYNIVLQKYCLSSRDSSSVRLLTSHSWDVTIPK